MKREQVKDRWDLINYILKQGTTADAGQIGWILLVLQDWMFERNPNVPGHVRATLTEERLMVLLPENCDYCRLALPGREFVTMNRQGEDTED